MLFGMKKAAAHGSAFRTTRHGVIFSHTAPMTIHPSTPAQLLNGGVMFARAGSVMGSVLSWRIAAGD
jgi:hypothetical protein